MDVLKSFRGWGKRLYAAQNMPLDFGSLAWHAASCPFSDVSQHRWTNETVHEKLGGKALWYEYLDGRDYGERKIFQSEVSSAHKVYFFLLTSQKTSRTCPIFKGFKLIDKSFKDTTVLSFFFF
ncbi:hypothetical protein TNCT_659771 [Trichonephila clavata]|uniref:Uncharacterized protein n=1 Tax=Trichonephila clavata TaxID=2740835 RepID=A0A8X6FKZ9_TRICU|nr:hypothetical protein TNCT_659771 [Trichonephila clavata]